MLNVQKQAVVTGDQVMQLSPHEADLLRLLLDAKKELLDIKTVLLRLWKDDDASSQNS